MSTSASSNKGSGGKDEQLSGTIVGDIGNGAGNSKTHESVKHLPIDQFSTRIEKYIEATSNADIYVFYLPRCVLKEGATNFMDFVSEDHIAQAYKIMFTLFTRFCCDVVRRLQKSNPFSENNNNQKQSKNKKKKKKTSKNLNDDEAIENSDEEELNDDEQDVYNLENEDDDDDELEEDGDRDQALFEKTDEDVMKEFDRLKNQQKKTRFNLLLEEVLHKEMSEKPQSRALRDRVVLGYRFWFINNTQQNCDEIFAKVTFKAVRRQNKKLLKKQSRTLYPHQWCYTIDDVRPLIIYFSILIGANFPQDVIEEAVQKPLSDPKNMARASSLFSPTWAFSHDEIINLAIEQQSNHQNYFSGDPNTRGVQFIDVVRMFVYRVQPNQIIENILNYFMLPNVQIKTLGQVTKQLPAFMEMLKNTDASDSNNPSNQIDQKGVVSSQTEESKSQQQLQKIDVSKVAIHSLRTFDFDGLEPNAQINRKKTLESLNEIFSVLEKLTFDTMSQDNSAHQMSHRLRKAQDIAIYTKATFLSHIQIESDNQTVLGQYMSPYPPLNNDWKRTQVTIEKNVANIIAKSFNENVCSMLKRKLFMLQQKSGFENYQEKCMGVGISPSAIAIIEHDKKENLRERPRIEGFFEKTYDSLTPFQHFDCAFAQIGEQVFKLNDKHQVLSKTWKNSMDAYRMNYNATHQHTLLQSNLGNVSKSYIQECLYNTLLIPNTSKVLTFQSIKSKAIDANLSDSITFFDEMPQDMIDSKKGGEVERMFKQLLSSNVLNAEIFVSVNGKRYQRSIRCEAITVFIANMNNNENIMSEAMKRRWEIIHCDENKEPPRSIIDMVARQNLSNKNTSGEEYKQIVARVFRLIQTLVFHIEKLIYIGALHQVSLDVCEVIISYLSNELTSLGYTDPNPSVYERIRTAARFHCILDAILTTWMFEGSEFYGKSIEFSQFSRLDTKLWANSQHIVKAIGDHYNLLIDPADHLVRRGLLEILYKNIAHLKNHQYVLLHQLLGIYQPMKDPKTGEQTINPAYFSFRLGKSEQTNTRGLVETQLTTNYYNLASDIHNALSSMNDVQFVPNKDTIQSILRKWKDQRVLSKDMLSRTFVDDGTKITNFFGVELNVDTSESRNIRSQFIQKSKDISRAFEGLNQNLKPFNRRRVDYDHQLSIVDVHSSSNNGMMSMAHNNPDLNSHLENGHSTTLMSNDGVQQKSAPTKVYEIDQTTGVVAVVHINDEPEYKTAAIVQGNGYYLVHRDHLIDPQSKQHDTPRTVVSRIIEQIFASKYQIPQRFAFDNHPKTPKEITFITCKGPSSDESKVPILRLPSISTVDEHDKLLLPKFQLFEKSQNTMDEIIIDCDLDSWAMRKHNARIGLTHLPILKDIYDINHMLSAIMRETNKLAKQKKNKIKSSKQEIAQRRQQDFSINDHDEDDEIIEMLQNNDNSTEDQQLVVQIEKQKLLKEKKKQNKIKQQQQQSLKHQQKSQDQDDEDAKILEEIFENAKRQYSSQSVDKHMKQQHDSHSQQQQENRNDDVDHEDNVYDMDGDGYFVGIPVKELFMDQNASLTNIPQGALKLLYKHLASVSNEWENDPLQEDVDFDPKYWIVRKHPSNNPLFHIYMWDLIADSETTLEDDDDEDHQRPISEIQAPKFVPSLLPKTDTVSPTDVERIQDERRRTFCRNIPAFKLIHTHPLIFNKFLNEKIKHEQKRTLINNLQEKPLQTEVEKRLKRWDTNKKMSFLKTSEIPKPLPLTRQISKFVVDSSIQNNTIKGDKKPPLMIENVRQQNTVGQITTSLSKTAQPISLSDGPFAIVSTITTPSTKKPSLKRSNSSSDDMLSQEDVNTNDFTRSSPRPLKKQKTELNIANGDDEKTSFKKPSKNILHNSASNGAIVFGISDENSNLTHPSIPSEEVSNPPILPLTNDYQEYQSTSFFKTTSKTKTSNNKNFKDVIQSPSLLQPKNSDEETSGSDSKKQHLQSSNARADQEILSDLMQSSTSADRTQKKHTNTSTTGKKKKKHSPTSIIQQDKSPSTSPALILSDTNS